MSADKAAGSKPNLEILKIVEQLKPKPAEVADEQSVALVVDRTQHHMAKLIKLTSLQKRIHFINHFVGDWKPTGKYKNIA